MSKSPGTKIITKIKNITRLTNFSDGVLLFPARNLKVLVAHVLVAEAVGGDIIAQFGAGGAPVTALDPEHVLQTGPRLAIA